MESFPYVAGFCGLESLSRNVAMILASLKGDEACYHYTMGEYPMADDSFGCQEWESELLAICRGKNLSASHYFDDWGRELLRMSDEELILARKQFGTLYNLLDKIKEIASLIGEDEPEEADGHQVESQTGKRFMDHLISLYGRPDRLGYFQKIHMELLEREKAWAEEQEQLQEMESLYRDAMRRSAQALSPFELPPGLKLRDLTWQQMASLEKWMARIPGISRPQLHHMMSLKFLFKILWEDQTGTERCYSTWDSQVAVQEAFRQALGDLVPNEPTG